MDRGTQLATDLRPLEGRDHPRQAAPAVLHPAVRRGVLVEFVSILALVAFVDQVSKAAVTSAMTFGESIPVLPPLLYLTLWTNTGIAFGLLSGAGGAVAVLAAVTALLLFLYNRDRWQTSRVVRVGLGMLLGGAIGNLIDRVRLGYVVDFIALPYWPVFNVADTSIVIGAAMLAWSALRHKPSCGSCRTNPVQGRE
jgi:signal peptidase II